MRTAVVLAVLLGVCAAAKLDGLQHHNHNNDHDHHHDDHHNHEDVDHAHTHTEGTNNPPENAHRTDGVAHAERDTLKERFNIQAGSIHHQEFSAGKPGGESAVQGSYSWKAPNGETFTVKYVADKLGFRPTIHRSGSSSSTSKTLPISEDSRSPARTFNHLQGSAKKSPSEAHLQLVWFTRFTVAAWSIHLTALFRITDLISVLWFRRFT
ncbi:hypothetical protein O3P69_000427 [Scylla paramamosain]|uniref:Cuticle protein n=1 Tax=Scylla paramamosain TaxID=85552 RepID=A0AAW0UTE0_SCYPA